MTPTTEFPPVIPFTDQVTVVDKPPGWKTVALKTCAAPAATDAIPGETVTCRLSARVTTAEAPLCGAAWLVAVIVTLAGFGKLCGAVKRPLDEIVPVVALPSARPFTAQITAVFVEPVTLA